MIVGGRGPAGQAPSAAEARRAVIVLGRAHRLLIVAACLICAEQAWAGPPFITDDPEPVPLHHWEAYVSSAQAKDPSETSGTLPHVEVNYGAAPNLQLHVLLPYAFSRPDAQGTTRGFGDTELGAKYRLVQETARRPMVGVFPLLEVPTGDADRGLGGGHFRLFLPVWFQKSWGPWTSYGGGGYWINPGAGNRDYWLIGWEIQRDLNERLTLGGEVLQSTPAAAGDQSDFSFNLGGSTTSTPATTSSSRGGAASGATRSSWATSAFSGPSARGPLGTSNQPAHNAGEGQWAEQRRFRAAADAPGAADGRRSARSGCG
jgi:hypothetical protein